MDDSHTVSPSSSGRQMEKQEFSPLLCSLVHFDHTLIPTRSLASMKCVCPLELMGNAPSLERKPI